MSNYKIQIPSDPGYHNRFGFPYRTTLSFAPYIEWLEKIVKENKAPDVTVFRHVLRAVKKIPELLLPVEDLSVLDKFRKEVDLLLSTIVPSSVQSEITTGVIIPFQPISVYATDSFKELVGDIGQGVWDFRKMDAPHALRDMIAFAGLAILNKHYGMSFTEFSMLKSKEMDKLKGTFTYFKPEINTHFAFVKTTKQPRPLSEIDLSPLNKDFFDIEYWLKNFPPDIFSFEGLSVYRMVDISDRELISQLEYMLLESTTSMSHSFMKRIEENMRSYFKVADLRLGIANMTDFSRVMCNSEENWFCLLPFSKIKSIMGDLENSIYRSALESGEPAIVDDLEKVENKTAVEKELISLGFRSYLMAPVFNEKEMVGMMELASEVPYAFNFLSMLKLKEIMPIVSLAFQREIEDFENRVQSTMKEYFTAIHPVVEWKFVNAAMEVIGGESSHLTKEQLLEKKLPPIQFDDVIPIYGAIDIRGSSEKRNEAIRLDMIDYLQVANSILKEAFVKHPLTILEELIFRIEKNLDKLSHSIDSGDETGILDFMTTELSPAFGIIAERDKGLKKSIDNFQNSLMPNHEFYHMRRKDFESALTMINEHVSRMIEEEEDRTQSLLPHYFEKYKTDGVEYNIYLGQSLLREQKFDPIYVKSFRLWQLMNMISIARETRKLKSVLPVELDTTQLILCYSNPFSIMFRMDEKRFDVAGAYNIRYEIVKKRIDKAHIKGTTERITQPGTIAIIYTQEKELREYDRYFEFLEAKGYTLPGVEYLDVEPLQGLVGLKALRIKVNYNEDEAKIQWNEEELFREIKGVVA